MSDPLIAIRDLRYRYAGASEDVLRIPSLDVSGSGLIAITGPSGAGKTTLVELLAGTLQEPYEGSVQVLGKEWKELRRDADRQRQLRRIGLIPQDFGLLPSWTPYRTLEQDMSDAEVPAERREGRVQASLAQVGLSEFAEHEIAALSGGQRQRVAIARMLARDVELVIADEPTANLDPELVADVVGLFKELARKVPVIVVTHDPRMAEMCDRTIVLQAAAPSSRNEVPQEPTTRPPSRRRSVLAVALVAAIVGAGVAGLLWYSHFASRKAASAQASTVRVVLPVRVLPTVMGISGTFPRYPASVSLTVPRKWSHAFAAYGLAGTVVVAPKGWSEPKGNAEIAADGSKGALLHGKRFPFGEYLQFHTDTASGSAWWDAGEYFPWVRTHWKLSGIAGSPPTPSDFGPPLSTESFFGHYLASYTGKDGNGVPLEGLAYTNIGPGNIRGAFLDNIDVSLPSDQRPMAKLMLNFYRAEKGYPSARTQYTPSRTPSSEAASSSNTSVPTVQQTTPAAVSDDSVPATERARMRVLLSPYAYLPASLPHGFIYTDWKHNSLLPTVLGELLTVDFAAPGGGHITWSSSRGADSQGNIGSSSTGYPGYGYGMIVDRTATIAGNRVYFSQGNHGSNAWTTFTVQTSWGTDHVSVGIWESNGLTPLQAMELVAHAQPA